MSKTCVDARAFAFDRPNMFEPLLLADPTSGDRWAMFREEHGSDEELPLYLALGELALHLIEDLEAGNTARFDAVFDVVERWHVSGDPYVREAATIGLLEDLQNGHLHRGTHPQAFLRWLRPETLRWWGKVGDFWARGTPIA